MNDYSVLFLKAALVAVGLVIAALCVFILAPALIEEDAWLFRWLLVGMLTAVVPFFVALFQTYRILNLVDRNKAFSMGSVKALRNIKYSAFAICLVYVSLFAPLHQVAQGEDAPGVLMLGLIISFVAVCVGVLTAVLEKLLHSAIKLKSENDLTV